MRIAVTLATVLTVTAAGCNPSAPPPTAAVPTATTPATTPAPAPAPSASRKEPAPQPDPVPVLDIRRFVQTYSENRARAAVEYEGRRFRISGSVLTVYPEGSIEFDLNENTERGFTAIVAMRSRTAAAALKKGPVEFEARFESFDPGRLPEFHFADATVETAP